MQNGVESNDHILTSNYKFKSAVLKTALQAPPTCWCYGCWHSIQIQSNIIFNSYLSEPHTVRSWYCYARFTSGGFPPKWTQRVEETAHSTISWTYPFFLLLSDRYIITNPLVLQGKNILNHWNIMHCNSTSIPADYYYSP